MSPDGTMVAVGGVNGRLSLVDLDSTASTITGTARTAGSVTWPLQEMTFSANSRALVVADDRSISVIGTDRLPTWSVPLAEPVDDMAVGNDGEHVSTTDDNGQVHLWTRDGKEYITTSHRARTAFSPDSRFLAVAGRDGDITLWDTGTGEPVHTVETPLTPINALTFSPDGRSLSVAGADGDVYLWHVPTQ